MDQQRDVRSDAGLHGAADRRVGVRRRGERQPLGSFNCGSVFKNPPGDYAARLIEACGLKGECQGAACVSDKHANFIINTGAATAADVERLIQHIAGVVAKQQGVQLQPEVHIFGEPA